ncbi:hypothetical protein DH2020_018783 [Rehmannia glutinosa]|uniref:Uncharacterized protein n=1 Tax=Rehmannia glutinosa TaxID=99300 RepID=A0ABR0WMP4_REHGL
MSFYLLSQNLLSPFNMDSPSLDDSSQKAIEGDLVDTGERLLALPSSTDELLILFEKAESLLAKVWQRPPVSTCFSLLPAMKALITNEILCHDDVNVQVAVASCFNELTRITCPDPPYDDDVMKVFFRLFMTAFRQLSCESGQNYTRALQIIETMAKVRSFLMLLDIDTDGLIVEMFQLFLNNINHPSDVFKYMEMIMTLVIEESDEISFELLKPLLTSVKMENKNTSPTSWELGKKVFENCATKLRSYLREAVKEMNLVMADYAVIVTCICHFISDDASSGKNMCCRLVALHGHRLLSPSPSSGIRVNPVVTIMLEVRCMYMSNEGWCQKASPNVGDGTSQLDGCSKDNGTKVNDENSSETLKGCQPIAQSGTDSGALRMRRGRKPNSVIRPEEGYEHVWTRGGKHSGEASSDGYNEEKADSTLVKELGNASNSSKKKYYSINEGNLPKRSDNATKKTGQRAIAESSNIRVQKEKGILSDTSPEGEYELLPQEQQGRKEIISQKHVHKDDVDRMEEFHMSKPEKVNYPRKDKEMKSGRSRVYYGDKLVNLRIQVWWPMDEVFYAGTVTAFDPETKKHTVLRRFLFIFSLFLYFPLAGYLSCHLNILYDDNETEILNLRKETWELCADEQLPQDDGENHAGKEESEKLLEKMETGHIPEDVTKG